MNRTNIEWTTHTWNPITGCSRGCGYCYAYWMAQRLRGRYGYPKDEPFRPTFHRDRLEQPYKLRKPSMIFTVSMGDFFDPQILDEWRERILDVMAGCGQHTFQILTKRYYNLRDFTYPDNLWLGVSQDCKYTDPDLIRALVRTDTKVKFASFEPLLGPPRIDTYDRDFSRLDWVIIGAQTGPRGKLPKLEWVQEVIDAAVDWHIPIFLKDNLQWPVKIQDWPDQ